MSDVRAHTVAQAKINLHLRVGPLRVDGFHDIATVFQRIELGDDVRVTATTSSTRSIVCHGADVGPPERNLAYRAAEAYARECDWPAGFVIEIDKRIPVGGGLGGGSADAAAVLRILNHVSPSPVSQSVLQTIAATLGSDVPFLVSPYVLAAGAGRGERLTGMDPLPRRSVALYLLPFGVNTADAYRWLDTMRGSEIVELPEIGASQWRAWEQITVQSANDFEPVVFSRHPELASLMSALAENGGALVRMSGSGSTIFAIGSSEAASTGANTDVAGVRVIHTHTANAPKPIVEL